MSTKQEILVGTIADLLSTIGYTEKKAETLSEPGSQGGSTEHPSKSVDDSLQTATEGSHSATNEADVKADQPLGVDKAEEGAGGSQNDKQMDIGITSKPTGEDPSVETGSAKGGKDDPGSEHPARTDNSELDGMKYASPVQRFRHYVKKAEAIGNSLTANIAAAADEAIKKAGSRQSAKSETKTAATPAKKAAEATPAEAAAAGTNMADSVTEEMDEKAVKAAIAYDLAETVAVAEDAAVRAVDYLRKCASAKLANSKKPVKRAEEGDDSSDPTSSEAPPEEGGEEGGGEVPPEGDPMAGGDGGGAPGDAELMAALSGGGDMGAGDAMAGMGGSPDAGGGAPPMDPMAGGGDPMAGGGAPPGDPMAGGGDPTGGLGAPGSGGDLSPEDLTVLLHVLQQAGISPEELQAAATAKQAAYAARIKKAGVKAPAWAPKTAMQKKQADEMLQYVLELTGKTKGKK